MPTYDMLCGNCGYNDKDHHYASWTDAIDAKCPECKEGNLEKQISGFNTSSPSFKGSSSKLPDEGVIIPVAKFKCPHGDEFLLGAHFINDDGVEKRNQAAMRNSSAN